VADNVYHYLNVKPHGTRACTVNLPKSRLDENELFALSEELLGVIRGGRPCVALALGPEPPLYMFSLFLARLITAQRVAHENGGEVKLCYANPDVIEIFSVCKFDSLFQFVPDFESALAEWKD